ncbi:unnamed protein product [Caenorhabditis auriculariae]|uniref:MAM domain-containing protein n=1 Tax=Caenorhabditis auriculariae TaxID=2777116 RepID=A0A8S1H1C7_9PELO|nr:unnamed protein product [Caenorhabditis auriculariae]
MALLRSFLLFIALTVNEVKAEISASSELNCDFGTACRWRNSTEDGGDFLTTMVLDTDAVTKISPMRDGDQTPFAYTAGFMGRTMAMLVSEVINCQLGGASLKYWYYKTGHESQLEVCIRQPPGSREPASLRCYDGVSSTFAKQWIFRAVELPPIAQPFEIVFRAFYFPPTDVIAIDDVIFDAALCGVSNRRRRSELRRIGYRDWETYRRSGQYTGELMLVVAQEETTTSSTSTTTSSFPTTTSSTTSTTSSTTTTTSTTSTPPTTSPPEELTTSEAIPTSSDLPPYQNPTVELSNFVNFLKQTAPVLPYIPTLVRSLSALDPRIPMEAPTLDSSLPDVRRAPQPVYSSHFYNTKEPALLASPPSDPSLVSLAKKFGLLNADADLTTVAVPMDLSLSLTTTTPVNRFGLKNGKLKLQKIEDELSSVYPQKLIKQKKADVEEIHKKIFSMTTTTTTIPILTSTSKELIIFKEPSNAETDVASKLAEITKLLPTGAMEDLSVLRDIPDLEGLTKGMDLTEIRKPGGFARLKKEFMERNLSSESSNGGNSEGAGGTFGENPVEVAQLADFEGNDLTLDAVRFETAASSPQTSRPVNFAAPTDSRKAAIGTKRPKASELSAPRSGAVYTPKCPAVDCDFNDGTLCSYVTSSGNLSTSTSIDGNNLRPWAVTSRSVLNSLTGVPHDLSKGGSFAFAKGTSPSEVFILSSDKLIEISEPARLDFFVYQAGTRGQLKVCIDDDTNCPLQLFGEDIDVDSQKWKNYYVDVPTGKHVFHFIVDGLFENYVIGIDNIQLLNRFGAASFPCP